MGFLTCYDKINAVVVLLKPNNSRMSLAFRFCVLEHKRGVLFTPEETDLYSKSWDKSVSYTHLTLPTKRIV